MNICLTEQPTSQPFYFGEIGKVQGEMTETVVIGRWERGRKEGSSDLYQFSGGISLLKIPRQQTSVTASGSEITARKTSGCRRCEVSRRSGLVCDVKKAILPSRVKRE